MKASHHKLNYSREASYEPEDIVGNILIKVESLRSEPVPSIIKTR